MYRITCKDGRIFDAEEIRTHKDYFVMMRVEYPYHEEDEGVSTYYWNDMFTAYRLVIKPSDISVIYPSNN